MEQAIFFKKEHQFLTNNLLFHFCGCSQTLPFHSFGPAVRSHYILHIVLDGEGSYQVNDQQFYLKAGDIFLIRPGDTTFYRSDSDKPWLYAWLSFSGIVADELIQQSIFGQTSYVFTTQHIQEYLNIILTFFDYRKNTLTNELKIEARLHEFFSVLLEDSGTLAAGTKNTLSPLTVHALTHIRKHFTESLTVQELAYTLSVNRSHLSRVFKEDMHLTLKEWITGLRMNRAAYLLLMTADSVEQIAEQSGFHSLVVFSRTFKQYTGESPTDYRKRIEMEPFTRVSLKKLASLLKKQSIISRAT